MKELKILKELQELIPPLDPSELEQLHRELDSDGRAIHPLVVWKQEGVLVDGHHRYDYCQKKGFPFEVRKLSFTSIDAVKNHMILQQLGRRNLDGKQKDLLRGKLYNARKRKAHRPTHNGAKSAPLRTREQIAKETGVSPRKVEQDAEFASAAEKLGIEHKVMSGEEKRPKVKIIHLARERDVRPDAPWLDDEEDRRSQVEGGQAVIANAERDKNLIRWADKKGLVVRVDRRSVFGNPFILGKDGDRDAVCDFYRDHYLPHKSSIQKQLPELKGKVLVCHCYPERCHGEELI